jgi:hypothetical protein
MARGAHKEPHKGIQYANVHPLIGNLCSRPDGGVDADLFVRLHTSMCLKQALDLAEIMEVGNSWRDAYQANAELDRPQDE